MSISVTGAYTSKGFISCGRSIFPPDCFTYILKGRPDFAKTDLMMNLINSAKNCRAEYDYEEKPRLVYCEDKNICVRDGTYPYSADAETYGVTDRIIDLSGFQTDAQIKKQAFRVTDLMRLIRKEEQRCERYLLSCAGIVNDCKRIEKNNLDSKKLSRYAYKLWRRSTNGMKGSVGTEKKCFLSPISSKGVKKADSVFSELCSSVTVINDWVGNAADQLTDKIRLYALSSGYDVISCVDILFPDEAPEHVIIPELKFGIYRQRSSAVPEFKAYKRIHARRFMLRESSDSTRNRISFSKKACGDLLNEAVSSIKKISFYNGELDKIYSEKFDVQGFSDFSKTL